MSKSNKINEPVPLPVGDALKVLYNKAFMAKETSNYVLESQCNELIYSWYPHRDTSMSVIIPGFNYN